MNEYIKYPRNIKTRCKRGESQNRKLYFEILEENIDDLHRAVVRETEV